MVEQGGGDGMKRGTMVATGGRAGSREGEEEE